ncbi:hypothetical protein DP113_01075 [Brasilonema octagenarum UFV-E1]|uniref:Uncharacterized protein n=2 Tax=Brasilonema TaxID=383614 RepID=A0A856M8H6_9CYAN|nr:MULTISPECIES: hypothetical protein [Brasilonema]NMF63845.1 hypothetical protein [Brasilonema octagenarum UFV-OR1]QDL06690.1 hypothetical protein DP114_01085 [Brasilonema sennae CENA114]QDL13058.1 hypothetical protein DP113_01075 [Brasilonema octagenarum UFV-E1]
MDLPLNLLVYTSFTNVGFELLTSEQVPLDIQQTFLKKVVFRYWKAFECRNHSDRAAYLLQVTLEDWLFGWLYNDEWDNTNYSHIPYFICYHLTKPLHSFQVEKVCACLQKGPLTLVERHKFSNSLKPLILKDVSSYQEAKPGVLISWETRQQIHMNLKQGKFIDLFIPAKEHEGVIELSLPVESQELFTADKSALNPTLLPLIPVTEKRRISEVSLPVESQELFTADKSAENDLLVLRRNFILLLGIGFGVITSLAVIVFIYVFFQMTSSQNQPNKSLWQNTSPPTTPQPEHFGNFVR